MADGDLQQRIVLEPVEALADELDAVAVREAEFLRQADVELRERSEYLAQPLAVQLDPLPAQPHQPAGRRQIGEVELFGPIGEPGDDRRDHDADRHAGRRRRPVPAWP